ncbi:MAG: hypothetical protein HQK83_18760 [Fibrobacteria bacterium]|nr:hypothetical protein [Fibrobacteria bacterium]
MSLFCTLLIGAYSGELLSPEYHSSSYIHQPEFGALDYRFNPASMTNFNELQSEVSFIPIPFGHISYRGTAGYDSTRHFSIQPQTLFYSFILKHHVFSIGLGYDYQRDYFRGETNQLSCDLSGFPLEHCGERTYDSTYFITHIRQHDYYVNLNTMLFLAETKKLLVSLQARYSRRKGFRYYEQSDEHSNFPVNWFGSGHYRDFNKNAPNNEYKLRAGYLRQATQGAGSMAMLTEVAYRFSYNKCEPLVPRKFDTYYMVPEEDVTKKYQTVNFEGEKRSGHDLRISLSYGHINPYQTWLSTPFKLGFLNAKYIMPVTVVEFGSDYRDIQGRTVTRWDRWGQYDWDYTEKEGSDFILQAGFRNIQQWYILKYLYFGNTIGLFTASQVFNDMMINTFNGHIEFITGLTVAFNKKILVNMDVSLHRFTLQSNYNYGDDSHYLPNRTDKWFNRLQLRIVLLK